MGSCVFLCHSGREKAGLLLTDDANYLYLLIGTTCYIMYTLKYIKLILDVYTVGVKGFYAVYAVCGGLELLSHFLIPVQIYICRMGREKHGQ